MYICKDCKKEYAQKPQYCDCGNDEFEEILTLEDSQPKSRLKEPYVEKDFSKKNFIEQHPRLKNLLMTLDVLSTSIFVGCLILSILAWIFIGKENPNLKQRKKHIKPTLEQVQTNKKIPDLDSFWNNTSPSPESQIQEPATTTDRPVERPQPQMPISQPIQPHRESFTTQPPTKINNPSQMRKNPEPVKPIYKTSNEASQSMLRYKESLRRTLFSHLAVTSVQGTGRCEVEFSVSNSGKLLNRRFSKLSDNKSLNDAVYNMLMSVPQYDAPPVDYNGEKIRLSFYFNNGYYEVSY